MVLCAAGVLGVTSVRAQEPERTPPDVSDAGQTFETAPDSRFPASGFQRFFLGTGWRELWPLPVDAQVLDLSVYAGGLTPTRVGGGLQTRSLRFQGADGREYSFRSIDKDPARAMPADLRRSFIGDVLIDRMSSLMPLSVAVVAPLLEAAGVLFADPTLVILPADPRLGEFQEEFQGMLGWIEERPDEGEDDQEGFAGAERVVGSPRFLERLEEDPENQVDVRSVISARLMDVYVGDWDRHPDQWRWAGFEENDVTHFQPIPRDRDWALSRIDGVVGLVGGAVSPHYVGFKEDYPNAFKATWAGRALDRRILVGATREMWREVATDLQVRLTDEVIEDAIGRLPDNYSEVAGPLLDAGLKNRRNELARMADDIYLLLAGWVDLHLTDEEELALATWLPGDSVRIEIFELDDDEPEVEPYFQRTFDAAETREVRVFLQGDDDRVEVRGQGPGSVELRFIGGGGNDSLVNLTEGDGGRVHFYDRRGRNTFDPGPGATVDDTRFEEPFDPAETTHQAPFRDWGRDWLPVGLLTFDGNVGLFLGAGVQRIGYGFRHYPYHTRAAVSGGLGSKAGRFRLEGQYEFPIFQQDLRAVAHAFVSGAEGARFYGFGNETAGDLDDDVYRADRQEILLEMPIAYPVGAGVEVWGAPIFQHFSPFVSEEDDDGPPLVAIQQPYGWGDFGELGVEAGLRWEQLDRPIATRNGGSVEVTGTLYPPFLDVTDAFGGLQLLATGFLSAPSRFGPTLAARLGAKKMWGRYPFQEAAYVGGRRSLRGFRSYRFAGDASLYLNTELRVEVGNAPLKLPGTIGFYGLFDTGRVFLEGESSNTWHASTGFGGWFNVLNALSLNAAVAFSAEEANLYFSTGFAY